jgi:hypothetical protein
MAKPRGRPKLPAKKRKGARLEIRVSDAELAQFEAAAKRADVSVSSWLRDVAIKAATS